MPDIFDQIASGNGSAAPSGGDVFDQLATGSGNGDIFDQLARPSPTPEADSASSVLGKIGTAVKHNIEPFIQHPLEAAYEMVVPTMEDIRSIGNLVKAETYKQNLQPGSQEWYDKVLGYSAPLILGAAAKGVGIARGIKPETPAAAPESVAPEPVAPRGPVPIEAQIGGEQYAQRARAETQAPGIQEELEPGAEGRVRVRDTEEDRLAAQPPEAGAGEAPVVPQPPAAAEEAVAPETISTKNVYTEAQRAARGFPEAEQAARRDFGTVWDEAVVEAQNDPGVGIRLVDELNKKPRNVSDTENAHLLRTQIAAQSEHSAAVEEVNRAPTESDRTAAQSRLDIARDNLQDVYDATKRAGTKSGQALAARQMLSNEDYTLAAMEARSRAANKGVPLNEPQLRKVQVSHSKITDLQNKLAAHEVTQAKALARYKTYLKGQAGKVGAKIAAGDFTKVPRQKTKLDAEAFTMRANLQRLKNEFERGVAKQAYRNKGPAQKFWDHFVGVQRGFKLSGPEIPGKLGVAAATREVLAPIESAGGYAVSKVLPGLAKGTKYGAGLKTVISSELKAKAALFTKGMKDAADNLRGRETQLEAIGDKHGRGPEFWYNRIGKIHAAIKAPVKRAEFVRSLEQRMDAAVRSGEDINHPEVMARLANEAGMDANRAIFQQNTVVSNFFSMLDRQVPAGARVARFLFPVVKIPINLFKELVTYHAGAPAAAVKIGKAYWHGIETLAPLEREAIIRQLVKGSVGGAALLWGYYNSDKVRGFFDSMPNWFGHTPIAMALNEGSYLKQMEAKNPEGAKGLKHMAKSDIPFMYTVTDITNALDSHDSNALLKWVYNMTTSTVDPQLLQQVAKGMDKPGTFPLNMGAKPAYRRPRSIAEAVMVGIPGLREQVPVTPLRGAGTSLYKGQRTTKGTRLYH